MTKKAVCPFCEADALKDRQFTESKNFRAICNIAPILPGHSLIIPKRHVERFMKLTEKDLIEMIDFSRKVMKILVKTFKFYDFDWTIQEGKCSGQTIPHLHLHLIPRKKGDLPEGTIWYQKICGGKKKMIGSDKRKWITPEELAKTVAKIRKNIK